MSRLKDETISIRTSAEIKQLLRMAAEREHRSAASMIEVLVLEYARAHELTTSQPSTSDERQPVSNASPAHKGSPQVAAKRHGH
jgi:hypothetical protein